MSVNKAILLGNVGKDPETRTFQDGGKVCNFSLATSERWKDKNTGERKERTEWHTVAVFGPMADIAARYLRKGSKVYVEGQLQTRKWQDQSGQDRFTTEVILRGFGAALVLVDKPEEHSTTEDDYREKRATGPMAGGGGFPDDEIPFAPEWR